MMRFKPNLSLILLVATVIGVSTLGRAPVQGATGTASQSQNMLQATAAATLAATPAFTPTPLPTLRSDLMGIQAYANLGPDQWSGPNGIVDRAIFMGFKWIKIQVSWKELETAKGQYNQAFEVLVKNIFDAGKRNLKVMLSFAKAPDWARPASARGQYNGPPANPQDLVDFMNALFPRLEMSFVNAIEIWNEPNLPGEWTGSPISGAEYLKLFNPVYAAIRAKYANIVVVTAGLSPTAGGGGSVDDRVWLQQLYTAGLKKDDPNLAIGIHPYGWANPPDARCCAAPNTPPGWNDHKTFFFLDTIQDYRDIMVKNGHAAGKLWATEFGWSTFQGLHVKDHVNGAAAVPPAESGLGWMNIITPDQQAQYIIRAYQLAQTSPLSDFMGPMMLWNMNFATLPGYINAPQPSLPEAGFSVLDSDWFTRPAYNLLQNSPKQ